MDSYAWARPCCARDCGETVCVNLIREWAGEPIRCLTSFVNYARGAKIPEEKIKEMVELLEKIANTVPEEKRRLFSEKELSLKREVSDEAHIKVIDQFELILRKK